MKAIDRFIDRTESAWMSRRARTARAVVLVVALLGGIALIEINRLFGEGTVLEHLPTVHLAAISWAIYLLLIFEFVEMAFAMSNSVAS
ncbi:MAG: hypothetical protein AAFO89_15240, partial [Planctomycetota bacterium]